MSGSFYWYSGGGGGGGGSASIGHGSITVEGHDVSVTPLVRGPVVRFGNNSSDVAFTVRTSPIDPDSGVPVYRLEVLDVAGTKYADLDQAKVTDTTWTLNDKGSINFTLPADDPKAKEVKAPDREWRLWRAGRIIGEGPIVRIRNDLSNIQVGGAGLLWYYDHRVFGRAGRINHFTNHSFEEGIGGGWNYSWRPVLETVHTVHAVETRRDHTIVGDRALYMETQDPHPLYGYYAFQSIRWTVPPTSNPWTGDHWTVSAWCYIPSDTWVGPTIDNAGLILTRLSTTEFVYIDGTAYPKVIQVATVNIDQNTARDKWIRMEASIDLPLTGVEEELQVILVCPHGGIYWDEVTLTVEEQTSFWDKEEADIISAILDHAVDPAYGKSDLRILKNIQPTGIKLPEIIHKHQDHEKILAALQQFTTLKNGVDFDFDYTPDTRTITSYFPRKGQRKKRYHLSIVQNDDTGVGEGNVSSCVVTVDGERVANAIVVLAEGSGSDREEGGAQDPTALDGGLVLEKVYNATPGTGVDTLQQQAERGLQRFKRRVHMLDITVSNEQTDIIGNVTVGDWLPVTITYNDIAIDEDYRVISIKLFPDTEKVTLTLNPMSEEIL